MHPNTPLYEQDFYAWTQEQGALLRDRKTKALDYVNLAEEVESLGKASSTPWRVAWKSSCCISSSGTFSLQSVSGARAGSAPSLNSAGASTACSSKTRVSALRCLRCSRTAMPISESGRVSKPVCPSPRFLTPVPGACPRSSMTTSGLTSSPHLIRPTVSGAQR